VTLARYARALGNLLIWAAAAAGYPVALAGSRLCGLADRLEGRAP